MALRDRNPTPSIYLGILARIPASRSLRCERFARRYDGFISLRGLHSRDTSIAVSPSAFHDRAAACGAYAGTRRSASGRGAPRFTLVRSCLPVLARRRGERRCSHRGLRSGARGRARYCGDRRHGAPDSRPDCLRKLPNDWRHELSPAQKGEREIVRQRRAHPADPVRQLDEIARG